MMRLGCFGTVKDIEAVAASGFDFIELNLRELIELPEEEFESVRTGLEKAGIGADAISWILPTTLDLTSPDTRFEDWEDYIKTGAARSIRLGTTLWPIGSGFGRSMKPENGDFADQEQRVLDFFSRIAEIANRAGIMVLIEPLGPAYSNYLQTLEQTVDFVRQINMDGVKTMCDLRHLVCAGVPLSEISKWGQWIMHTHIDPPVGDKRCFPRPGDPYDYTEYFCLIQETAATRLSVEALHEESLEDGAESVAFMRQMLARTKGNVE